MANPNPFLSSSDDDLYKLPPLPASTASDASRFEPITPQEAKVATSPNSSPARAAAPTRADVIRRAVDLDIDPRLALSIWSQESGSGSNPKTSDKGARGGFQVMPGTFKSMMGTADGQDDPWNNMEAGLRYIAYGQKTLGTKDPELIAAGYHAGYDRRDLKAGRIPNTSDGHISTADYARSVAGRAGSAAVGRLRNFSQDVTEGGRFEPVSPDEAKAAGLPMPDDNPVKNDGVDDPSRYEVLTPDQISALQLPPLPTAAPVEAKAPDGGGFMGAIKDVGKNLKIGADMAAQDMRELVGRIPVVGQSIVKGGDAVDRYFHPEVKDSGELLKNDSQQMQQSLTPAMQGALEKKWWDSDKGTFGPAWSDWRSYAGGVTQSLPEQAVTMVPALRLAKVAYAAKIAAGAGEVAAAQAAARAAQITGSVGEGLLGGAQSSREVRDQVNAIPQDVLNQSDAYQSLVKSGMNPDAARTQLANDLATRAFVTSGTVTGLFGGMGDRALAKIFTEKAGKSLVMDRVKAGLKGGLAEGVFEELPQSAGQQLAQNEAARKADNRIKLSDDVANQALGGMATGFAQGAGMGAIAHGRGHTEAPQAEQAPAEAQPATPSQPVPPAAPAPAASTASGPLTRSAENAADQQAADSGTPRVTATAPDGSAVEGQLHAYQEDGQGGFAAQIVGDDGQVYTLSDKDGVQITPQEHAAGPLTGALHDVAEKEAGAAPAPVEQAAPKQEYAPQPAPQTVVPQSAILPQAEQDTIKLANEVQAKAPDIAPAATEPARAPRQPVQADLSTMSEEDLRARLKYIASQAKSTGGWNTMLMAERKRVEREINQRAAAQPAQQAAPAPVLTGPFTTQAEANAAMLKAAEATGKAHEVVWNEGQFTIKPIQEAEHAPANDSATRPVSETAAPAESAAPPAQSGAGKPAAGQSETAAKPALSRELAGAKPRYAYGSKQFDLNFANDIDRAAYIAAQKTPSKRDADYVKFVSQHTGMDEQQVREHGVRVREAIKGIAKTAEPGKLDVPAVHGTEAAAEAVTAPVRDEHAGKWFGSEDKARAYITKRKIGETHMVKQTGRVRFEVVPKEASRTTLEDAQAKHERQDEAVQAAADSLAQRKTEKEAVATSEQAAEPAQAEQQAQKTEERTPEPVAPAAKSEQPAEPVVALPQQPANDPNALFAKNKLFTADKVEAARARMRDKLRTQLNSGIDPELMMDGMTIAGAYIEAGVRRFADFAKAMTDDLGDAVRPYLLSFYEGARHYPGLDTDGMSSQATAKKLHEAMIADMADGQKTPTLKAEEAAHDTEPTQKDAGPGTEKPAAEPVRQPESGRDAGRGLEQGAGRRGELDFGSEAAGDRSGHDAGETGLRRGPDIANANAEQPVQGGRGDRAEPSDRGDRQPGKPKSRVENYRIAQGELAREGSWKKTAERNVGIVELTKTIMAEGRQATPAERAELVKFTGWGASEIANGVFPDRYGRYKDANWQVLGERLKAALTPEEYAQARRTTQYAHYTSEGVIRSIYQGLERLGFHGGTLVEPGMGVGHFAGLMPDAIAANSHYTGIEYDPITGNIAKLLYPASNIQVGDFTRTNLPKDFFDAAIGNPPFSQTQVLNDPEYKAQRPMLHDYFFMKTIDRVKPGGLLVFVTSKGTMDKTSDKSRRYLAERANLLGAVRLPQTAFKDNAGTEVVTDVIFLQKRGPGIADNGVKWLDTKEVKTPQGPTPVNEYFADHPEMVLGRHALEGSMYRANEYTVLPREGDIEQYFAEALQNLPENVTRPVQGSLAERALVQDRDFNPKHRKEGGLYLDDNGRLMQVEDGSGVEVAHRTGADGRAIALTPKQKQWLKGYVQVRDAMKQAQFDQLNDGEWQTSLKALNTAYDGFVEKHGPVLDYTTIERTNPETGETTETKRFKNEALLRLDTEGALAYALENIKEDGSIVKGAALQGRVLDAPREPEIKTTNDALFVSLNRNGVLDLDDVARLAGTDKDSVIRDLGTSVYEAPGKGWQLADEYLSGNVVRKLTEAQAASEINPKFKRNVDALLAVQPRPLGPTEITVRLGANWVPASDIQSFAKDVLELDAGVTYNPTLNSWNVDTNRAGVSEFGFDRMHAGQILDAVLNSKQIKLTYKDSDGGTHPDIEGTEKANDIASKMRERFRTWLWTDPARADRLTNYYNEHFNNIAPRQFDGQHLTLPGVSSRFNLYPHQKRAVWRVIQQGDTYLAHAVGAGKALEVTEPVLTPTGWRKIGDLAVGDMVIAGDGTATRVTGVYPQGAKPTFDVRFSDGASVIACGEHLWETQTARQRQNVVEAKHAGHVSKKGAPKVRNTLEILGSISERHTIPLVGSVEFDPVDVPLDAYTLGALIGDGSFRQDTVQFGNLDREMLGHFIVPNGIQVVPVIREGRCPIYRLSAPEIRNNPIHDALRDLGLWWLDSRAKFVPANYLFNAPPVRLAMLQGLMDTDGGMTGRSCRFTSYSEQLARDVVFLARSLGGIAVLKNRTGADGEMSKWTVSLTMPSGVMPFRVTRKVAAYEAVHANKQRQHTLKRFITEIVQAGERECVCISVAHESKLFVTKDFIVTHNTMEMIASAMEERRLGLVNKPMFVTPNHMLAQFSREFLELYPAANIMVADEHNFHSHNRKRFVAQAALNNPDAIVITHSGFGRIGMSDEFSHAFIQKQIDQWQEALDDAKGDRITTKQIERRIEQLERRLEGKQGKEKKDKVLDFEELGVDKLYVDEFHEFRKLDFATNQGNVKGVDPNGSARALDMMMKVEYLRSKKPGRSLVAASGTPVTNTMGELYTAQRFFQPEQLREDGLDTFDAWSAQYGDIVTGFEQNAAGGYEMVSRFAKFQNVPELMRRVRSFMDILTSSNLGELVKRPDVIGGGREVIVTPVPEGYKEYQQDLQRRIQAIKDRRGPPEKGQDIILNVIGDGRFSAIDMRFVDPSRPSDPNSKLNLWIDDIIKAHRETANYEYADKLTGKPEPIKGASIIGFSDIGLGEASAANRGFDMRGWIEQRFKEAGIPADEVAFMRDYKQHAKKERLFADMREGKKRILIGGKEMETGTNVQKRLTHLFHLDAPWFPASVEQREGRIIRQGNQNREVKINAYATKGSYDSTMWGMNARKARFIEQAMNGDDSIRSMDDVSEASAFEMAAALASGDQRYMELAGLKSDVDKLERLRHAHYDEQNSLRRKKHWDEDAVARNTERVKEFEDAIAKRTPIKAGEFAAKVGKQAFDSREEFSQSLFGAFKALADAGTEEKGRQVGEIGGFPIRYDGWEAKGTGVFNGHLYVDIPGDPEPLAVAPIDPNMAVSGLATRAANQVNGLDRDLAATRTKLDEAKRRIEQINKRLGAAFPEEQILMEKVAALNALQEELAKESKEQASADAAAATIKTEANATEENAGEEKLSVGSGTGSLDKAGLRSAITGGVLGPLVDRLIENGNVVLHDGIDTLPSNVKRVPGMQGATAKGNVLHLVGENLTAQNARAVLLHEAFHNGAEKLIGTGEWNGMMKRLDALYRQGQQSSGKAKDFWNAARERVQAAEEKGAVAKGMTSEEFAAYAIEEYESAPATIRKWVDDLIGMVKAWVQAKFGKQLGEVTPGQLSALAKLAILDTAADQRGEMFGRAGELFSVNDSRTVEVDGVRRPIVDSQGNLIEGGDFNKQVAFWRNYDGPLDDQGRPILDEVKYSVSAPTRPQAANATTTQQPQNNGLVLDEPGRFARFQAAIQDNMNRVKQVQDKIAELTGAPVKETQDYYGAETNRPGRIAAKLEDAQKGLFAPLMKELAKSGHTPEQLQELLHAMHAHERNEAVAKINPDMPDGGSGMTDAQANAILARYKGNAALHALADKVRAVSQATLDLKKEYGLIQPEKYEELKKRYEFYVPLKGDGEFGPKIKRAMGHGEREENILEHVMRDYEQAVVVGEKNLARQSLLRMVLANPDKNLWTVGVPPKGRYVAGRVYDVMKGAQKVATFDSQAEVRGFLEAQGAGAINYHVVDSAGERVVEFTKPLQDNEVPVYVKGDLVRIQINGDDALARQLRPLNQGQMHPILEGMRKLNRWLSAAYTGYNPAFILRNATRDAMTGTINMTGHYGAGTAARAWLKYPSAAKALLQWASTGKVPSGDAGKMLAEYRAHGGKMGASYMSDLEQQSARLEHLFEDAYGAKALMRDGKPTRAAIVAGRKIVGGMAHGIEIANQATENALRLALYMQLRQEGASAGKAAQAAKTVTVDFDRKGTMTPALGAIFLFFNPAVQGTANAVKTLVKGEHKVQAFAALGAVAALGFLAAAKGMDDDKDRWLGEGWETRSKNFMLNIGGKQFRMPMSQEFAPVYALGVALAEASRGESAMQTAMRITSSFFDAYFPFNGAVKDQSDNRMLDVGLAMTPTILQPYMQAATNRSSFGQQVVPDTETTKNRPDNLKMFRGTKGSAYDAAAQTLASAGEMLGAGKYENDITKVSPETLKLLWKTYTGGLGGFVADSIGLAGLSTDPGSVESDDVPILKDFVRSPDVKPIRARYYDLSREAEAAITEFEQAKKAGDGEAIDKIAADPAKLQVIGLGHMVKSVNKAIGSIRDEEVSVNADPALSVAEKRAKVKALEAQEEQLLREAIKAYK